MVVFMRLQPEKRHAVLHRKDSAGIQDLLSRFRYRSQTGLRRFLIAKKHGIFKGNMLLFSIYQQHTAHNGNRRGFFPIWGYLINGIFHIGRSL